MITSILGQLLCTHELLVPIYILRKINKDTSLPTVTLVPSTRMPRGERYGHRKMAGYEVCIHTCGCKGRKSSPLWLRNGGACSRHAADQDLHPMCETNCPGQWAYIPGAPRAVRTREPTVEEIEKYLTSEEAHQELVRLGFDPDSTDTDVPTNQ